MTSGSGCSEMGRSRIDGPAHRGLARALAWAAGIAAALGVGFAFAGLLAGCGAEATVAAESPRMEGYEVTAGSDGTEQSQRAVVTATFDRPIAVGDDALDDLVISVDGAETDDETIRCSVEQVGERSLRVVVAAEPGVTDPAQGPYFALLRGRLSVSAKDASGGLAHVTGQGGTSSAVWSDVSCIVPSGLEIETVSEMAGGEGRAATTTFKVVRPPQLRVCSWLQMEPDGERILVHNHEFLKYDAASYAAYLAESLAASLGPEYESSSKGDRVTVAAATVAAGQRIRPVVVEGPQ